MNPIFYVHWSVELIHYYVYTTFGVLTLCNKYVICISDRFLSFIFELCIMSVHTLKMCTDDAGPGRVWAWYKLILSYILLQNFSFGLFCLSRRQVIFSELTDSLKMFHVNHRCLLVRLNDKIVLQHWIGLPYLNLRFSLALTIGES